VWGIAIPPIGGIFHLALGLHSMKTWLRTSERLVESSQYAPSLLLPVERPSMPTTTAVPRPEEVVVEVDGKVEEIVGKAATTPVRVETRSEVRAARLAWEAGQETPVDSPLEGTLAKQVAIRRFLDSEGNCPFAHTRPSMPRAGAAA